MNSTLDQVGKASLIILTLCGFGWLGFRIYEAHSVEEGQIVRKYHQTSHYSSRTDSNGNHHSDYQPERWVVVIEGKNKNGKVCERTLYLTPDSFSSVKQGETVSVESLVRSC